MGNAMAMLSFSRELSDHLELEINYDYMRYDSDFLPTAFSSHRIAAGILWHLNPL
jgi:hypothetical protein